MIETYELLLNARQITLSPEKCEVEGFTEIKNEPREVDVSFPIKLTEEGQRWFSELRLKYVEERSMKVNSLHRGTKE